MTSVVFSGMHGDFYPDVESPYFDMPDGCTLYLFTEALKTMKGNEADALAQLSESELEVLRANAAQTIPPGSCQNLVLSELAKPVSLTPGEGVYIHPTQSGQRLWDQVEYYAGLGVTEFYWFACRAIVLAPAGGRDVGVNAVQPIDLTTGEASTDYESWDRTARQYSPLGEGDLGSGSGTTACAVGCPECGEACWLREEHRREYAHRCANEHQWAVTDEEYASVPEPRRAPEAVPSSRCDAVCATCDPGDDNTCALQVNHRDGEDHGCLAGHTWAVSDQELADLQAGVYS